MDWDDLRYVLAVARHGSALRAASAMGVNQTTVMRRLEAIESALGEPLFERSRSGQTLTPVGQRAAELGERIELEAHAFLAALAAERRALAGAIRLTTSEALANRLVTPCLPAFRARHPDISIEVITGDQRLDIARGDADVALRAGSRPEGAGIVARRLPDAHWAVYASRGYVEEHGCPADRGGVAGHEIVGGEGRMALLPALAWLAEGAPDAAVRFRSSSMVNMVANLKAGLGLGMLPIMIGDEEPALVRCFPAPEELRAELWLIVHAKLKARTHVRAFTDFLAAHIRETLAERPAAEPV